MREVVFGVSVVSGIVWRLELSASYEPPDVVPSFWTSSSTTLGLAVSVAKHHARLRKDGDGRRNEARRKLNRWVARATTPRGAAVVIASVTATITVGAGILMTLVDHDQFPSIGSGLWWAAQTVTTVGYGDDVPVSVTGRFLAVGVMLVGIGFLTVITAAITSTFVARARIEATPSGADRGPRSSCVRSRSGWSGSRLR